MAVTLVRLRGRWEIDGAAATGKVSVSPSITVVDQSGHVIVPRDPVTRTLVADGTLPELWVVAADSDGLAVTGFTWEITERVGGSPRVWHALINAADAVLDGGDLSIWLDTLTPSEAIAPSTSDVLSQATTAVAARATALESRATRATARRLLVAAPILAPLPVAMASPPTITQSADNAASTVTSPVAYSPSTRPDLFTVYGGTISLGVDPSYFIGSNITPGNTTAFAPYAVEVVTDSALLDITVRATGARFRVLVDGQLANTEDGAVLATAGGANKRIIVAFSEKALRTIRLESDGTLRFNAWTISTTDYIAPAVRRGPRCIVAGDSITEGTGATGRFQGWARLLGWHLGWPDTWASGSGGTGYCDDGTPTYTGRKKMADRIATDVTAYSPDVVVLAAGRNDTDNLAATVQAEATACIQAVRTALPDARLYVTGPLYYGTTTGQTSVLATEAAILAATAAAGGKFLSVVAPNYLFGTGKVGSTNGTGPCDTLLSSDGVHPSQDGHRALARVVAALIAADLAAA